MRRPDPFLVTWYGGLLGGLLPVLLLGFLASALADRLAFAGWGLAVAAVWTVALRHGMTAGWPGRRLAGVLALVLALGFAAFAALAVRHREILGLGFQAMLPVGGSR